MFIYKITNKENNKCYIGFDTKEEYKQNRWKAHIRNYNKIDTKFYKSIQKYGIDNFIYEVIDNTTDLCDLLLKEIYWIGFYDSYRNGYNSTVGGDGHNHWDDLTKLDPEVRELLRILNSKKMIEYNKEKWNGTTTEERKELTEHLHNTEIYTKKSNGLKKYWKFADEEKRNHQLRGLKNGWKDLTDKEYARRVEINKESSLKGAKKLSIKVKVKYPDNTIKIFDSKSEASRITGLSTIGYIIKKTRNGLLHKGWQIWEI